MADESTRPAGAEPGGEGVDVAQTVVDAAQDIGQQTQAADGSGLNVLLGVTLALSVELGRTRMKINDILELSSGSVVELNKLASEPVDVLVNDTLFARGEVVVIEDQFAVKITQLVDRRKGAR